MHILCDVFCIIFYLFKPARFLYDVQSVGIFVKFFFRARGGGGGGGGEDDTGFIIWIGIKFFFEIYLFN